MSYAKHAYPDESYSQQENSVWPKKKKKPKPAISSLGPEDLIEALQRSAHGLYWLKKLHNWLSRVSTKVKLDEVPGVLTENGIQKRVVATQSEKHDRIDITISLADAKTNLVFHRESYAELRNIMGCRELSRIKLDTEAEKLSYESCTGDFSKCNYKIIEEEYKARIEYHLLYPPGSGEFASETSTNWLLYYQRFFDIYYRLEEIVENADFYMQSPYCDDIDRKLITDFQNYRLVYLDAKKNSDSFGLDPLSNRSLMGMFESDSRMQSYVAARVASDAFQKGINLSASLTIQSVKEAYNIVMMSSWLNAMFDQPHVSKADLDNGVEAIDKRGIRQAYEAKNEALRKKLRDKVADIVKLLPKETDVKAVLDDDKMAAKVLAILK